MAECKECLYYEVCADFRRNICETDQKRFEEYKINSNGICDRFYRKIDFQKIIRCKDCKFNVANMEKDPLDITDYSGDDIVCSYFMTDGLDPNDYCSQGKCTPKERGREK